LGKATLSALSQKITPIVLAGGYGRRLWPLSTKRRPKQFLPLINKRCLFDITIERVGDYEVFNPPIIIGNKRHENFLKNTASKHIILEDEPRNTGPAIAKAIKRDGMYLVLPCDHVITDVAQFQTDIFEAMSAAQDKIVVFGIQPTKPNTAFGYIRKKDISFHEKPNLKTAREYYRSKNYLWNAGLFLFKGSVMLDEIDRHCPSLLSVEPPQISIDHAVMEQTNKISLYPARFDWGDIGSWKALIKFFYKRVFRSKDGL